MGFKQFVLSLRIIHLALIMGVCLICLILFFAIERIGMTEDMLPFNENFLLILAFIPWFGSRFIYRNGISKLPSIQNLGEKLLHYRKTLITSLAISEGVTMLSIILYFFMIPSQIFLFVIVIGLISMLLLRPSEARIKDELQLYPVDEKELETVVIPSK